MVALAQCTEFVGGVGTGGSVERKSPSGGLGVETGWGLGKSTSLADPPSENTCVYYLQLVMVFTRSTLC